MRRLMRDVGVNVIANLIAAAIVYLLGAYAGYWRLNPELTTLITTTLLALAVVAVIVVYAGQDRLPRWASVLLLVALILFVLLSQYWSLSGPHDISPGSPAFILIIAVTVVLTSLTGFVVVQNLPLRPADAAAESRISRWATEYAIGRQSMRATRIGADEPEDSQQNL